MSELTQELYDAMVEELGGAEAVKTKFFGRRVLEHLEGGRALEDLDPRVLKWLLKKPGGEVGELFNPSTSNTLSTSSSSRQVNGLNTPNGRCQLLTHYRQMKGQNQSEFLFNCVEPWLRINGHQASANRITNLTRSSAGCYVCSYEKNNQKVPPPKHITESLDMYRMAKNLG
jgi:hypothetical protein